MPVETLEWTSSDLAVAAGLAVVLAAFVMATLRYEAGLPFALSLLVVPVVVAGGFVLALALHVWLAVHVLHAAAILSGMLVALVGLYEVLKLWVAGPPPPSARY